MGLRMITKSIAIITLVCGLSVPLIAKPTRKVLFFTKSSGFEHDVISWKKGQPSFAEKIFLDLGAKNSWEFVFSKDGSKFSPEYLADFAAVVFYTSGDLTTAGKDRQPPMTEAGKKALFDYVKGGKGFVGLHSASDTFKTNNKADREAGCYVNHGKDADPYICMLGGEFITHGAQQVATNKIINPGFPGFDGLGDSFTFHEEWYSIKDFNPDIHALTVIDTTGMKGDPYKRPAYPTTWAREEGKGRVYYTAMGHREDVWTNPTYQSIVVGAIRWATREVDAAVPPNLKTVAPEAATNPPMPKPKKKK